MSDVETTEKPHLSMPDFTDTADVKQFMLDLQQYSAVKGVPTLQKRLVKLLNHQDIASRLTAQCRTGINFVNGVRTHAQVKRDDNRSLKVRARKYFESLPTAALRKQCELFEVDYDSYEDMADIIVALVDKNMAMTSSNGAAVQPETADAEPVGGEIPY
jgi:hypothetical protein